MSNAKQIIEDELNVLSKAIVDNLRKNDRIASGKTANSLRVDVSEVNQSVSGKLVGSSVLFALQDGRKKTTNGGSTRSWEQELRDWMAIRGIPDNAFYPIWRKINAEGYEGTTGLIDDPITAFDKNIREKIKLDSIKTYKDAINRNTKT